METPKPFPALVIHKSSGWFWIDTKHPQIGWVGPYHTQESAINSLTEKGYKSSSVMPITKNFLIKSYPVIKPKKPDKLA